MFEDYLEDSYHFVTMANQIKEDREAKRYYRAAIFYALGAIEAFLNFIADTLSRSNALEPYELAFLMDRRFGLTEGRFEMLEQFQYSKLEDKLRFLLQKFAEDFNFQSNAAWSQFLEFKRLRDSITHPRQEEDEVDLPDYRRMLRTGLSSTIDLMNNISQAIFRRPLRRGLLDFRLQ
jgi:hypothetical protein